jgi:predicted secreted hydrolase
VRNRGSACVRLRPRRTPLLLLLLLLGLTLASCAAPPHVPLRPVLAGPTATLAPIRLPADDAPHDALMEWWYYTGHLAGAGHQYGFEEVVFQVERQDVPVFYAGHFAITNLSRGEFHFDQRTWFRDQRPTAFDLGDGTWRIAGNGTADTLRATMADYALDATFTPQKPPAFHGNNGIVSFGPAGDSYYYSTTRASIAGTLLDHGASVPVTGEAWKDRQWGNFLVTPGGGWDWYSLQLDDGTDIMLFILRDTTGTMSPAYGTIVDAEGKSTTIESSTVSVLPTGSWTSPHTQTTYPSGWKIDFASRDLSLILTPVLRDQELDTRQSTGQIYWEGDVRIAGQSRGQPLGGRGYVELTGYAKSQVTP